MGIGLIIVVMVENEQGYEDFTDTSVQYSFPVSSHKPPGFAKLRLHRVISSPDAPVEVATEINENGARTSRTSPFRLGGENTVGKILQPSAKTTDLTRRGNSNVLAPFIAFASTAKTGKNRHHASSRNKERLR